MAKAKKLPSGSWRVQASVTIDGKVNRKSFTKKTAAKAESAAEDWQNNLEEIREDLSNYTLSSAIDDYISVNSEILSPSTKTGYRKIKRCYLQDLMPMKLNKMTNKIIQLQINKEAANYSPKTVINAYALLSKILKEYRVGFNLSIKLPQRRLVSYATPEVNQIKNILDASKNTKIEIAVLLAALLGMRMSEIRGLKWSNVSNNTIKIDNAIVDTDNGSAEKGTKTFKSTRTVIIPSQIKLLLDNIPRTSEYVVPLTANAISKSFSRMLEKNSIPHCRFHDLRHANASIMLMLGVPDKYAMERGGWSTPDTLKKVYQQTFNTQQELIAKRLDDYYLKNFSHDISHGN